MNASNLRRWMPGGGQPSAAHLNEPVDWINGFQSAMGMGSPPPAGEPITRPFLAVISATGPVVTPTAGGTPAPASDLTGAMYWVRESGVRAAAGSNATYGISENRWRSAEAASGETASTNIHAALNLNEYLSGSHTLPVGTPAWVFQIYDGGTTTDGPQRRLVFASPQSATMIGVRVTKDGGANGSKTTAASWTYTVKDLSSTTTFGHNVPVRKPRPNGKMNFGTVYGTAFYDAGILILWDAGEYPDTGGC